MLEVRHLCAAPAGRRTISNGTPGFGVPQRASRCFTYPPACTLLGYLRASIFHIFHILPYLGGDEGSTRLVSGVCGGCVVHVCVWWLLLEVHEVAKVISHLLLQYQGERDRHVRQRSIPISNPIQWACKCELIDDRCFHHIFLHDNWLGFLSIPSASVYF